MFPTSVYYFITQTIKCIYEYSFFSTCIFFLFPSLSPLLFCGYPVLISNPTVIVLFINYSHLHLLSFYIIWLYNLFRRILKLPPSNRNNKLASKHSTHPPSLLRFRYDCSRCFVILIFRQSFHRGPNGETASALLQLYLQISNTY